MATQERLRAWALPAVVVLFWLQLFNQLRFDWAANPQYGYGWFVPLLAAGTFLRRWPLRPVLSRQRRTRSATGNIFSFYLLCFL